MRKLANKIYRILLWGLLYFICLIGSMVASFKVMFIVGKDD